MRLDDVQPTALDAVAVDRDDRSSQVAGAGHSSWIKSVRRLGYPVAWRARRARLVTSPVSFFWGEVRHPAAPREYQLAGGSERILIRHHNHEDSFILSEIFEGTSTYEIPAAVHAALGHDVSKVVDIGGNIGFASLWFARAFPNASFTIIEADATNADVLEQTMALNDMNPRVTVIRAAAGAQDGELEFISGLGGRSHVARPGQAATTRVPMIDALPLLADCDVLKLDIEGGEWPILTDARLADIALRAICLEYHLWNCPGSDPTATARALLKHARFHVVELREEGHGGVIWAVR
jgi:FkbM family methyltransferase